MSKELVILNEDDPKVMELVTQQIARGATKIELRYFIAVCNRMGLDPFAKQIWAVKRWDSSVGNYVMGIQTGIDGFRSVANRSGIYEGQTAPMWCGPDGIWKDVWISDMPPIAAKVGVYRKGFREPTIGIVKYDAVVQKTKDKKTQEDRPNAFWSRMPDHMLAKCAEAQALRKAFPNECGSVYTDDEITESEPELAESGKKDFEHMERMKQKVRDVTPIETAINSTPAEILNNNEESRSCDSNLCNDNPPQEPIKDEKKPRNFAAGELQIAASFAMLHKFGHVKNVPEPQAKAYLLKAKEWAQSAGKPMPEAMIEMVAALEAFWGL